MLRHLSRRLLPAVSAAAAAGTSTPAALPTLPAAAGWAALHSPQSQRQQHRDWHGSAAAMHGGGGKGGEGGETIGVTFVEGDSERTVRVPLGKSLLEAAHDNDIELEGACEGSLACSTCHVIVMNQEYFDLLDEPEEDELDMLDLAFGLTETSRLGCQVLARKDLDGLKVKIPSATRNFAVDGFKPKPH
mmetsp:Transcript_45579/g.116599  ORF Transcript_45579/g.116599 Transcript_45579/m.116599 type:complete len:189 (+) Transcript_45579:170-736(+)|eukprot:jgi/Tetstr1/434737/TSEL_023789.t1